MNRQPRTHGTSSLADRCKASKAANRIPLDRIRPWFAKATSRPVLGTTLLLSLGCLPISAYQKLANNVMLSNGSAADTQKAIDAATDGTIIKLPSGKFRW